MKNPILDELYGYRDQIAQECDYDIHAYFERMKKKEAELVKHGMPRTTAVRRKKPKPKSPRAVRAALDALFRNPVLEEIRGIRDQMAEECGNDMREFFKQMKEKSNLRVRKVSPPVRRGPSTRKVKGSRPTSSHHVKVS
jgi:hypothetical protein